MSKRLVLLIALLALSVTPMLATAQEDDGLTVGFLPGVVDPFYQVMEVGVRQAVADSAVPINLVVQIPETWGVEVQTPILDAMIARGDLDYLIIAATDREQLVAPLQAAYDAGIEVISVDTFIGDSDYVNGPVTFPLSYIGSDNVEGGRIAARALGENLEGQGKLYIQNTTAGTSTVEQRSQGFREGIAEFPGMEIVDEQYNDDIESVAVQQTAAILEREPELAGIFGVNVFSAAGAGTAVLNAGLGGEVEVVAFDATQFAIEQLRAGSVSLVIAQKPFDMGYLAVQFALADYRGVTSLPKRVPTGYAVITADNVDDPEVAKFIYQVPE